MSASITHEILFEELEPTHNSLKNRNDETDSMTEDEDDPLLIPDTWPQTPVNGIFFDR